MRIQLIDAHKQDTLFSQNQGTFFLFSKKGRGDLPPPSLLVARLENIVYLLYHNFIPEVKQNQEVLRMQKC